MVAFGSEAVLRAGRINTEIVSTAVPVVVCRRAVDAVQADKDHNTDRTPGMERAVALEAVLAGTEVGRFYVLPVEVPALLSAVFLAPPHLYGPNDRS